MDEQAQQRLQLLLSQLELTDDVYASFFEKAELTRMTVHKSSRVWQFTMRLQHILPAKMLELLQMRMNEKFSHIASVHLSFEAREPHVTEELVHNYWQYVLQSIDDMAPPLRSVLTKQLPIWTGNKIGRAHV